MIETKSILDFWFIECSPKMWFKKSDEFDALIRNRFLNLIKKSLKTNIEDVNIALDTYLSLIILLDQFTRNVFRDTLRAFVGDNKALVLSQKCCDKEYLKNPDIQRRKFMLMPMMHSEKITVQEAALPLFKKYTSEKDYEYAKKHHEIIARFGRFPHRNVILGRKSTNDELLFLKQPGSSF